MQEEIFGPVTCVTPFDEEEEVISRAKGIRYGLSATVWSRDVGRMHRVARKLQAGLMWTNCWLVRDFNLLFGVIKTQALVKRGEKIHTTSSLRLNPSLSNIDTGWSNICRDSASLWDSCVISNLFTNYIEEAIRLDMIGNKVHEKIKVLHTVLGDRMWVNHFGGIKLSHSLAYFILRHTSLWF